MASGWQDSYAQVHGPGDPGNTFHGFKGPDFEGQLGKIDWVFSRGASSTNGAEIIRDHDQGRYPSDHYFVTAQVALKP